MINDNELPDPADFDYQAQQLARRRKIAEQLMASPIQSPTIQVGDLAIPNIAGAYDRFLNQTSGNRETDKLDRQQALLDANQARVARQTFDRLATPGTRTIETVDSDAGPTLPKTETVALTPAEERSRRIKVMGEGMAVPSIRAMLQQQLGQELDYPQQDAVRQENAAARQHERELAAFNRKNELADRQAFTASQNEIYRRTAAQQAAGRAGTGGTAGQGKAPSGYRWNGDQLEPIPGGPHDPSGKSVKLTAAQQKAYDDSDVLLGHIDNALVAIKTNPDALGKKTIIPDIALGTIDPEGVQTRAAVAGLAAEKVHQLSGAAVSPAEFARLRPYLPASGDSADTATKKLTNLRGEVERIKAAHARGPTMANRQAVAPAGNSDNQPTVVRTGVVNGRKVEQLSDGSTRYAR